MQGTNPPNAEHPRMTVPLGSASYQARGYSYVNNASSMQATSINYRTGYTSNLSMRGASNMPTYQSPAQGQTPQ